MKVSMLFKQVAIGVGVSAVLVGTAMAAPVASFDYTQEFEFVEPIAPSGVVKSGSTAGVSAIDGFTKLNWGTEANSFDKVSSLVINPTAGDSETPSGNLSQGTLVVSESVDAVTLGLGPTVVHNNFVITGTSLNSTSAQDNVVLSPFGGGDDKVQNITFGIDFEETTNNPSDASACPAGVAFNSFGCGDIFALSGGLLGVPTILNGSIVAFLIDNFRIADYIYDVFITSPGLDILSDEACVEVGGAGNEGCIGFTTFENETNAFALAFAIVAREAPIPEPATIALLAGSLLLMGLVRRKKVSSLSA